MWWKEGVVYQVYPRSFQDSNNDGIGDLRGLIQRLDYLNDGTSQSLGIDAVWLSPFYPSPMCDFGYDISDYCAIDPVFGTMDDFDQLIAQAHQRNIRIILDLVVNHTSDQHPWFQASCDASSDKAGWYIWHEGSEPPNNWLGCLGGKGWTYQPQRDAWYFHSFLPQQPDLNWRHPAVKQAVKDIMAFWLNKGVDGFRLDVINLFYKDARLRSNPVDWFRIGRPYDRQNHLYDRDQAEMHPLLQELRQWVDRWPRRMMVGEIMQQQKTLSALPASYYGDNDELHLAFNFDFFHQPFSAAAFRAVIQRWETLLGPDNWPNYTLSNHDFMRHSGRYKGRHQALRMKLLATLLLTLRGTPFLYYGEETGMPEQRVPKQRMQDPVGLRYWPLHPGRDGCRRPMMWSGHPQDFSPAAAWLPNEPQQQHSVAYQQNQPDSLLNWYRTLIHYRKASPALRRGSQRLLPSASDILAYERCYEDEHLIILLNFSARPQGASLLPLPDRAELSNEYMIDLNNQPQAATFSDRSIRLNPCQAVVIRRVLSADQPRDPDACHQAR
ncbi:MAG: hypothetical protein CMI02_11165 [Oceanospirillaceae bacterium]|nr:hypothetical protein [Oceanospirillaceae bacterium]MBT12580.1 hypothetical protein [Oceanospirillaceae bacterium]|tara:strand:- start:13288 stop:14943 length:1656 start_codon:yes stop_codon:yes gene_type:complete